MARDAGGLSIHGADPVPPEGVVVMSCLAPSSGPSPAPGPRQRRRPIPAPAIPRPRRQADPLGTVLAENTRRSDRRVALKRQRALKRVRPIGGAIPALKALKGGRTVLRALTSLIRSGGATHGGSTSSGCSGEATVFPWPT